MADTPETPLPHPEFNARALRIVQGAALTIVAILSVAVLVVLVRPADPCAGSLIWVIPVLVLLVLPYLGILFRLREKTRKQGLALALWWSAIPVVIGLLVLGGTVVDVMEKGREGRNLGELLSVGGFWGLVALFHAVMFGAAIKTYYSIPREPGDWRKLADGLAGAVLLFIPLVVAAVAIPSMIRSPRAANESAAVGSLRAINVAAGTYEADYGNGFPAGLAILTLPQGAKSGCHRVDLLDPVLASGTRSHYTFEYLPGPLVEKPAAGCPAGVRSYSVSARPVGYGRCGYRNFWTDQSGVIRFTPEDRAATANDPPLQ